MYLERLLPAGMEEDDETAASVGAREWSVSVG